MVKSTKCIKFHYNVFFKQRRPNARCQIMTLRATTSFNEKNKISQTWQTLEVPCICNDLNSHRDGNQDW